jgi:threonine/homoserine/homoserine lactone efflux protein
MYYYRSKPIGITFIILGLIAVLFALRPLLLPIILIFGGIYLINLGLQMHGKPPLIFTIQDIWIRRSMRF